MMIIAMMVMMMMHLVCQDDGGGDANGDDDSRVVGAELDDDDDDDDEGYCQCCRDNHHPSRNYHRSESFKITSWNRCAKSPLIRRRWRRNRLESSDSIGSNNLKSQR